MNTNTATLQKAITWKMTGKMSGMASLSTSPLCNPNCMQRCKNNVAVCKSCYSIRMMKRYKALSDKLTRNTEFLTTTELQIEDVPFINTALFRFESFGDLVNALQVKNYFTICEANKRTQFALWTKNPWLIAEAMETYGIGKPENLVIIQSSVLLNTATAPAYDFIDKVFTVYDKAHAEEVEINCGARNCASCQRCYTKTSELEFVNELLK